MMRARTLYIAAFAGFLSVTASVAMLLSIGKTRPVSDTRPARDKIQINALILSYDASAMNANFGDICLSYAGSRLKILHPADLAETEMMIYHENSVAPDELWRREGVEVTFEVDSKLLRDNVDLFSAGVSRLQRLGS